jgi:repressor LexA
MMNNFSDIGDRIQYLIDNQYNSNKKKFAESIGYAPQVVSNIVAGRRTKPSYEVLNAIISTNVYIDSEWLLTGKGKMIKEINEPVLDKTEEKKGIPLIPIEAMAGYSSGDSQVMQYDVNSGYNIPELEGRGVEYLIRVSGSSMYPKYSNGDLLACKPLKDLSFFQWGKPYVLDTEQGAIVKRLFQCDENQEYLECHSDNKIHYPPFNIPKTSVRAVAIVVGVIRLE